jgi:hypothetical protein
MKYILKVTETNNKAGKFLYEVVDENGAILCQRRSNRVYAAATIFGNFFFGRVDLIGKGDHGRFLKNAILKEHNPEFYDSIVNIAYKQ